MTALNLYKFVAYVFFALFVFYVFDIRRKKGMVPIVTPLWTQVMKSLSLLMLVSYAVAVWYVRSLGAIEWVALGLTSLGACVVAAAKITLGRYHTWVGYHMEKEKTRIVQVGIYGYLRHPLYTGLFLFEFGGIALIVPRIPTEHAYLTPVVLLSFAYLMGFNIVMAGRESGEMARKFGADFEAYQARVRAFIPVRRTP